MDEDLVTNISKIVLNECRKGISQDEREFWHRVAVVVIRHWEEMKEPGEASEDRKEEA